MKKAPFGIVGLETDVSVTYTIDKNTFVSKGKNTPFHGRKVTGKVRATVVDGSEVYEEKAERM